MPETIGQRLRQARDHRNLSLRNVAEATRIRAVFLQALEADDYSGMTSAAQARGFLRNYADYLGLDLDGALAELQQSQPAATGELVGPLERVDLLASTAAPSASHMKGGTALAGPVATSARQQPSSPPELQTADEPAASEPEGRPVGRLSLIGRWRSAWARRSVGRAAAEASPRRQATAADGGADVHRPAASELSTVAPDEAPGAPANRGFSKSGLRDFSPRAFLLAATAGLRKAIRRTEIGSHPSHAAAEESAPAAAEAAEAAPAEAPPKLEVFADIVAEIGQTLRQRRELLGLSHLEIESHIHLKAAVLAALEQGAFDKLPSTVQLRGMLVNYATFLDLDIERLMLRFADALQARHRQKYPERPRPARSNSRAASMPPLRAFVAPDLLFGIGITAALLALGIWGAGRLLSPPESLPAVQFTAPSISEVLAGTSQPGPAEGVTPTVEATVSAPAGEAGLGAALGIPTVSGAANVRIDVTAVERSFMRVSVDGTEAFNGRVLPGTLYPFEAEEQVEILTGNGAALRITYNGRDMGLMGTMGQVVSTIFTASGIATATATLAPSPTPTSLVTATPVPSNTPTATASAANSAP